MRDKWLWLGPVFVVIGASLWGAETYFRVGLNQVFDSEVLVFHEHLFCLAFTLPVLLFIRPEWRHVSKRAWIFLILSGSVGSAIGTYFFTLSLRLLNASVANILMNFQPIVSVVFASLLLHERWGRKFYLWASGAVLCGMLIAWSDFHGSGQDFNVGLLYVAIAALAWGFSTVAGRGVMLEMPLSLAVVSRFAVGTLTLLISLLLKGKWDQLNWQLVPVMWKPFVALSFVTGVLPIYFYFKGLQKTSASVGGFCELCQTISALIITWGVMGQPLTSLQVAAGFVLLVCVYQINLTHARAN